MARTRDLQQALTNVMKQVKKHVREAIDNTLRNEVFEMASEVIALHVQTDVYDKYIPQQYRRRSDGTPNSGWGLGDMRNLRYNKTELARTGKLIISNHAKFNPRNSNNPSSWVKKINFGEDGGIKTLSMHIIDGWSKPSAAAYTRPRPYMENAARTIMHTDILEAAFDTGLARHGIFRKD